MKPRTTKKPKVRGQPKSRRRFGIGEWYGQVLERIDLAERKRLAELQFLSKKARPAMQCPFRPSKVGVGAVCTKPGGVCTLRLYEADSSSGLVSVAHGPAGALVTTCPNRFQEAGLIYQWVGETLLNHAKPLIVSEIGFLEQPGDESLDTVPASPEDVGRIDSVLVHPSLDPLAWCALEMQAVYFSGSAMKHEFEALRASEEVGLLFPSAHRRPDFRSSGPKRLMPQLQIKVPTLRRWGKKMAVVIDRPFFDSLGKMDDVKDVSNADIAWFVVNYEEGRDGRAMLRRDFVRLTTLERAVEGLTGGMPVGLSEFELRIREKLAE